MSPARYTLSGVLALKGRSNPHSSHRNKAVRVVVTSPFPSAPINQNGNLAENPEPGKSIYTNNLYLVFILILASVRTASTKTCIGFVALKTLRP